MFRFPMPEKNSVPLYQQIYTALVAQIHAGELPVGTRLPGKRTMASHLAVSVNTVDTAYQMLVAEGYLDARAKSGFFVASVGQVPEFATPAAPQKKQNSPEPRFDLSTGATDTSLFPFRTWGRIQKELLYAAPELLSHGPRQGEDSLRLAICRYLSAYRAVQCTPEQIVVGAGMELLLSQLAVILRGGCAATENPGYRTMSYILEQGGVKCLPVPVDAGGICISSLEKLPVNICCVTPSHHFPTAVTMGVSRRTELLNWAKAAEDRCILEDDYDAEFRYDTRPLPSLQGMAGQAGKVVYLFTFSKSLAPGIRIACMVLPPNLLERYRNAFGHYANTVSRFEQQTLCRFMDEGYFVRHLARMRATCRGRMQSLCAALGEAFGTRLTIAGQHTGLHLLLTLKDGPGEGQMVQRAAGQGILLHGLSEYYREGKDACPPNTVLIGYAALPQEKSRELAELLRKAWQ